LSIKLQYDYASYLSKCLPMYQINNLKFPGENISTCKQTSVSLWSDGMIKELMIWFLWKYRSKRKHKEDISLVESLIASHPIYTTWISSLFCLLMGGAKSGHLTVLKMKIWIYWSKSNSWIYFYIVLNKNWKFTGPNKVLLVVNRRTGAHC
jgi:hypothetical protein